LGIDDLGFGISFVVCCLLFVVWDLGFGVWTFGVWTFGVWTFGVPLRGLMIFDLGFRIIYYWGDFRGLGGFRSFNLLNHLNSLNLLNFFDVITNHQRQGKCCFSGVVCLGIGGLERSTRLDYLYICATQLSSHRRRSQTGAKYTGVSEV
jgi:hypothetical protein